MKSRLVSAAIATIALALPTTASAAALSDLLDIDTSALEDVLPGTAINVLTDSSNPAAMAMSSLSSPSGGGSCGTPSFSAPTCGGGGGGYMPSFGFGVTPIVNITFEISLTIHIDIDLDVAIGGDFGSPAPSATRCCMCSGF